MNREAERSIPARASSGKSAAIELSFQWTSYEGPPLADLYISKLGGRFWGESWHFLPDEAERLAQLLNEAVGAVGRRELGLVGQFVQADRRPDHSMAPWLTVSVSPAPYLHTGALRVRLVFDDEMTTEAPDAASLWFTVAASQRLARWLRQTVARALSDGTARREVRETVIPLDRAYPSLISGHLLRVTEVGLRVHRINVYWVLTPQVAEDELSKVLEAVDCRAADDLGNEYSRGGCGYSSSTEDGKAVTRGLFALKPGPRPGATLLRVFLEAAHQSSTNEKPDELEVDLRRLGGGLSQG